MLEVRTGLGIIAKTGAGRCFLLMTLHLAENKDVTFRYFIDMNMFVIGFSIIETRVYC